MEDQAKAEAAVRILLSFKERYGSLNQALVQEYIRAYGMTSQRQMAQDLGLSRAIVRRCLQEWSK